MITAMIEDNKRGNLHISILLDKGYKVMANSMLNSKGTKTLCNRYIIRMIRTRLISRAATVKTEDWERGFCSIMIDIWYNTYIILRKKLYEIKLKFIIELAKL